MEKIEKFCVETDAGGGRLDVFLAAARGQSRARVQALIKAGLVEINGTVGESKRSLRAGDIVQVTGELVPPPSTLVAEDIPLAILFEDETVLVLNKPPGLVVHPAAGNYTGTLVQALLHHCGSRLGAGADATRPGIVHRLDKDTSGVIVVAKTDKALESLSKQFADRAVRKIYQAMAWGKFRKARGEYRGAIGRHPQNRKKMAVVAYGGRSAHTDYQVLKQWEPAALVECHLHTGRTHQIRVHLAALGHAILGDGLYGRARHSHGVTTPSRQMLHAARLGFRHPRTGKEVEFSAPLPEDFIALMAQLDSL